MAQFRYPDKTLHALFFEQAAKTPERIAVIDGDRTMTYAALARAATTLADALRHRGVTADVVVPIFMPRCLEFAVAYVAALAAGGATCRSRSGIPPTCCGAC